MKICIVGGIFLKGGTRSSYIKSTPETILEDGLRAAGHEVTTLSHYDDVDYSRFVLIHVHHLSYGALRLAADPGGKPFLFTLHDGSYMMGIPPTRYHSATLRYINNRADAIISLSNGEADHQRKYFPGHPTIPSVVIPNGISSVLYPFAARNPQPHTPWKLLFCAQLLPIKNADILIKAVAQLKHPVELSLAYQTALLEPELKLLAASLGIADRVHFLGKVDPAELAALHKTHDLFVLPSSTEALPSVITECMYSGLPFIATPVGGVPEQTNGFGHLLQKRTPEDLAAAIHHVFNNYSEYVAKSQAMSNHARAMYSISSMIERHIDLYEQVASKPPVRSKGGLLNFAVRTAVRQRGTRGPGKAAAWAHLPQGATK